MSRWISTGRARSLWGVAGICTAGLWGCATVGPNFQRPAPPAAEGFVMAGDARPARVDLDPAARTAGAWWRSLGSRDLDAAVDQALLGNQDLAAAVATLDRAREEAASERGARKPRVDASAGGLRERINTQAFGFPGFPSPTINQFSIGGTVSYNLDLFGGERRKIEAAEALAEAQARRADAAYLALTGNVALQAVRIAGLRGQIAQLRAIAADDRKIIDIQDAAEAAGGAAPSAGVGGRAQLAEDEALLPPLARQLAKARHALALLAGRAPAAWTAPDFALEDFTPPARIPVSLPSQWVRRRPDILAAEADLHAATAKVGVATADLYPNIRLTAGLTQLATTPTSLFGYNATAWNFGAGVAAPLFHGGSLRADKRAAEAAARASLARYRQTVLTAFVQVADILTALAQDDERLAALSQVETTARVALSDAKAAYDLGGGALLPMVLAQRRLDQARLNRVDAAGARLGDIVELYAATATDWREAAHGEGPA